ncbi:MAG TPA: hypothetical protein VGL19_01840, partial [Polyangiaceae bacterium]
MNRRCIALSVAALLAAAVCVAGPAQARLPKAHRAPLELNVFGPTRPLTDTAWLLDRVGMNRRFDLGSEPLLTLLERYVDPGQNRAPEWRSFWHGRYGRHHFQLHPKLSWPGADADALTADATDAFLPLELRTPEFAQPALAQPFDFSRA